MQELSKKNKEKFLKQVEGISTKDETIVKDKIQQEIESLIKKNNKRKNKSLESLITNASLLAEILKNEEFPISLTSKKWIVFGLNYLVSDVDLIPDAIPLIGYTDDALILNWVMGIVEKDLKRYKKYLQAKNNKSQLLDRVVQGNGEQIIVFFPGFFQSNESSDWLKQIRKISSAYNSPGISLFNWDFNYIDEIKNNFTIIDHKLSLKPIFDSEAFSMEWQQLKIDMHHHGKQILNELEELKKANPEKEIIAISLNIGMIPLLSAIKESNNKLMDKIYIFGGSYNEHELIEAIKDKNYQIYNFFSDNDHAITYIFDNYEEQKTPIGLGELHSLKYSGIKNIDCSDSINHHQDYKFNFARLINESK